MTYTVLIVYRIEHAMKHRDGTNLKKMSSNPSWTHLCRLHLLATQLYSGPLQGSHLFRLATAFLNFLRAL